MTYYNKMYFLYILECDAGWGKGRYGTWEPLIYWLSHPQGPQHPLLDSLHPTADNQTDIF